ncbi:MAG: hypothetical protein SCALA702_35420 [Melioribacteraceae bacterium]|nr:MAG: hypothetical protein SCALA702_35420 [Melioribacteraceae bacterium]
MRNILLAISIWIVTFVSVTAQQPANYIEYDMVQGKLEESDSYKKEFGRYDGFQVYLNKGEFVYFSVFSEEFNPSIILVTPGKENLMENQSQGTGFASIKTSIPETGEYYVYIIGTANSRGNYFYQYAFADSAALKEPEKEFCDELQYVIKHSDAYFLFLQENDTLYKISDTEDAFIDGNDGSYNTVILSNSDKAEAEKKYIESRLKLQSCLGEGWNEYKSDWQPIEDFKQKKVEYSKKTEAGRIAVILKLNDFSTEGNSDYSLEMVFINTK